MSALSVQQKQSLATSHLAALALNSGIRKGRSDVADSLDAQMNLPVWLRVRPNSELTVAAPGVRYAQVII